MTFQLGRSYAPAGSYDTGLSVLPQTIVLPELDEPLPPLLPPLPPLLLPPQAAAPSSTATAPRATPARHRASVRAKRDAFLGIQTPPDSKCHAESSRTRLGRQ